MLSLEISAFQHFSFYLSKREFDGFDALFTELGADPGEQHGFHLFEMEAHGGLGDTQDEVAVFHGDRLGVAGNEVSCELLPRRADLVFVEAVLQSGRAED